MIKIFRSSQVKEIDSYTIKKEPIVSVNLMERAATALLQWIILRYNKEKKFKIFIGPGNNGGDGLALARLLTEKKLKVEVYILKLKKLTGDPEINLKRLINLEKVKIKYIEKESHFPEIEKNEIIIDALFGSGLDRPLSGLPALLVKYINNINNEVIAVDMPSGLFGEDNSNNDPKLIIKANYTLSFQFPALSFLFPENDKYVGEWYILPIGLHPEIINSTGTQWNLIEKEDVKELIKPRTKYSHKGTYGHALLISGSYGKMGAAVLASKACIRCGTGLLTTHIPKKGYDIIQTAAPEVMVSIDKSNNFFTETPDLKLYSAIGIGPGLGLNNKTQDAFLCLLNKIKVPIVIDADGLNILSKNKKWLKKIPENSILTPHPKEFERLAGKSVNSYIQNKLQIEFSKKYKVFIILKRANTLISCPDGKCYFNPTGNPGMATGGSGDVLTGMILSFLAQNYSPKNAAFLGVFLHGLAGDIASDDIGEEALIATDIIDYLSDSFMEIKSLDL